MMQKGYDDAQAGMGYAVKLTQHAIVQIQETIAYISKVLLEPETARAWSDFLKKEITAVVYGLRDQLNVLKKMPSKPEMSD